MLTSREIATALNYTETLIGEMPCTLFANHPLLMSIGNTPFDQAASLPFCGKLPIMLNFQAAAASGAAYYQVLVDNVPTTDSWTNYKWDGRANVLHTINVMWVGRSAGCYPVHPRSELFLWQSPALGCVLDSRGLTDGPHTIELQFLDSAGEPIPALKSASIRITVDNNTCPSQHACATKTSGKRCSSLCCPYEPAYS